MTNWSNYLSDRLLLFLEPTCICLRYIWRLHLDDLQG